MQNLLLFKIQSKTHRYTSFSRHKSDAFLTICLHHFSILLMRYVKKVETRWMKLPFEVRSWRGERTGRKAKEDPFLPSLTPYKLEYNNFTNYHSLWSIFFYDIITHIHFAEIMTYMCARVWLSHEGKLIILSYVS